MAGRTHAAVKTCCIAADAGSGQGRVGKVQSECAPAPSSRAFSCSLQLPDFCIGRDEDVSFTSGKRSESTMAPQGVPRGAGTTSFARPGGMDRGQVYYSVCAD